MKRKREYKDCLTNETLLKKFKSQFDLVRYAITLADDAVQAGRESGKFLTQNLAFNILSDIDAGREVPGEEE